jgi:hypothetical protein
MLLLTHQSKAPQLNPKPLVATDAATPTPTGPSWQALGTRPRARSPAAPPRGPRGAASLRAARRDPPAQRAEYRWDQSPGSIIPPRHPRRRARRAPQPLHAHKPSCPPRPRSPPVPLTCCCVACSSARASSSSIPPSRSSTPPPRPPQGAGPRSVPVSSGGTLQPERQLPAPLLEQALSSPLLPLPPPPQRWASSADTRSDTAAPAAAFFLSRTASAACTGCVKDVCVCGGGGGGGWGGAPASSMPCHAFKRQERRLRSAGARPALCAHAARTARGARRARCEQLWQDHQHCQLQPLLLQPAPAASQALPRHPARAPAAAPRALRAPSPRAAPHPLRPRAPRLRAPRRRLCRAGRR